MHGTNKPRGIGDNRGPDPADELLTEIEQDEQRAALIVAYITAETIDGVMAQNELSNSAVAIASDTCATGFSWPPCAIAGGASAKTSPLPR